MKKSKWIEVPCKTKFKVDGIEKESEQLTSFCFDPPMEVTPHPVHTDLCLFTTGFGSKLVCMDYKALMKKLKGTKSDGYEGPPL